MSTPPSDLQTLKIHDLSRGGAGVARGPDGRIVFVPYTAPGDVVKVEIFSSEKNYSQGRLIELIEPSPQRQTPPCPVFGRCGGCQWQHLPYELQWRTKVQGVLHALKRVQLEVPAPEELPAQKIWEYRNRVQLRGYQQQLGFYAQGTQDLVPTDRCAIARPEINAVWEETRDQGSTRPRPYKVEVEVLPDGTIRKSWNSGHAAQGFRQVHDDQNLKLQGWVADQLPKQGSLLDLYGGSGNLSLAIADRYDHVDCVDVGAPTRRDPDQPSHYHFNSQSSAQWLVKKASQKPPQQYGAAILDPPRDGMGADFAPIADALSKLGVEHIVAVGCDPDSWARDISRLAKRGWRPEKIAVLDLFPQTPHVESLAYLRKIP